MEFSVSIHTFCLHRELSAPVLNLEFEWVPRHPIPSMCVLFCSTVTSEVCMFVFRSVVEFMNNFDVTIDVVYV